MPSIVFILSEKKEKIKEEEKSQELEAYYAVSHKNKCYHIIFRIPFSEI